MAMKNAGVAVLALALVGRLAVAVKLVDLKSIKQHGSPVEQVVELITSLKEQIIADGNTEQASYDKYACWCEDTLGRKANDITAEKDSIDQTERLIIKLKAEVATHTAEIASITKDIAQNIKAAEEAEQVRAKEYAAYEEEKTESEQCLGALEAAIRVLQGAGTKKGNFLSTLREVQLMGAMAGMRSMMDKSWMAKAAAGRDLDLVREFIARPGDFLNSRPLSAAQVGNNPYGDYAPKSTQIQGILKGMYDSFASELEKDNAKEADARKSFEQLMETKQKERETLQTILEQHKLHEATKTKTLAESKGLLDDTKAQLDADEALFADTKTACKEKANEWATRTRMRTEELQAIAQCVQILSSDEAKKTFENATSTLFLQVKSDGGRAKAAYGALKAVAMKYKSMGLAQIAAAVRSGGHFDKVIQAIDAMMQVLRQEEQDDIAHRDRCQRAQQKNKYDLEDEEHSIEKTGKKIQRLQDDTTDLQNEITAAKEDINKTLTSLEERKNLRIQEYEDFKQALKDDADAVKLLEEAITIMADFYKKSKSASMLQSGAPTYSQDKPPETNWGKDYSSRRGEGEGIVAILGMIKEDLEKEIKTAQSDDAEAQSLYETESAAIRASAEKQEAVKVAKEKELMELQLAISDAQEALANAEAGKKGDTDLQASLEKDCAWVATSFDSRREKRKAEMDGLVEAKGFLSGASA